MQPDGTDSPQAPPAAVPSPPAPAGTAPAKPVPPQKESIKDTFISIIIAFVLAFVFRGFVVEAFVIPTGSMAPTLMGAHMRFRAPESGYSWPVGPWDLSPNPNEYVPVQGRSGPGGTGPIVVHDPMTGQRIEQANVPRRSGDRILVLKFLYGVFGPQRFDVVVFKDPVTPTTNFIKRLIGLPGEEVALVDGDVFVRKPSSRAAAIPEEDTDLWSQPGWEIARKPSRVQGAVWQEVFDSRYAPLNPSRDGRLWYTTPWVADSDSSGGGNWNINGQRIYEYTGAGATGLAWDRTRQRYAERGSPWGNTVETWEIDDRYPYNELPPSRGGGPWQKRFPVSDVRVRAGVEPTGDVPLAVTATVAARGHEFEAHLDPAAGRVTLRMRGVTGGEGGEGAGEWREMATAALPARALRPGRVTDVEFWHVDQSVQVWVDGARAAYAEYDWSPAQRVERVTGETLKELLSRRGIGNVFEDATLYQRPGVRWGFSGGPLRLHRVGLDRDLHYQPANYGQSGPPALATHPANTPRLSPDEFFTLGDNSPASQDGRLWEHTDPWVAKQMWEDKRLEAKAGVVPRELMIGKAFFVYFPSLHRGSSVPVPDFGRLRFIW